nr:hypothetical protein Iba_chr14fCG1010 [Ipomoea batatas]
MDKNKVKGPMINLLGRSIIGSLLLSKREVRTDREDEQERTVMAAANTTVTLRAACIVHGEFCCVLSISPLPLFNPHAPSVAVFIIPSETKEIEKGVLAFPTIRSRKMDGEPTMVVGKIEIRIPANKDISHLNVSMPGSVVKWGLPIDVSGIKRFYLFIISLSQQY